MMTRDDEASSRDEGREGAFGAMRVGYIPPVGSSRRIVCTTPRLRRIVMASERGRSPTSAAATYVCIYLYP